MSLVSTTTQTAGMRRLALIALMVLPVAAVAQGTPARTVRRLSFDEAVRTAEAQSQTVQIARAGLTRAGGQHMQARSQYLPQVNGVVSYAKTLRSQFQGLSFGGGAPDSTAPVSVCSPRIPQNATPAQRQAALDQATSCQSGGGGIDFSSVGFGAKNQWTAGLQVSQNVFTFGRISGQVMASDASVRTAEIEVAAQRAQLVLDVTQAYFDAALTDRLVTIADSALAQTDEVLRQTTLARQVGNQSEFDLLRAQVTRDNQVPVSIQRRSDRQLAFLRLKQLLSLPLDDSLELGTPVDEIVATDVLPAAAVISALGMPTTTDTLTSDRAPVRQLEQAVRAQEGLLRAARADRLPAISVTSGYQRLYFPAEMFPDLSKARENWTVGVTAAIPIFNGGRSRGGELVAEANLNETRARLQQAREVAAMDTRAALNALRQAEAAWRASQGTAEQATRAYSIDQIRYREGLSTQTDLSQSRLLLESAMANRAVSARDLAVARVRLALLKDLPIQLGSSSAQSRSSQSGGATGAGSQSQQQPSQQRQSQATTSAAQGN